MMITKTDCPHCPTSSGAKGSRGSHSRSGTSPSLSWDSGRPKPEAWPLQPSHASPGQIGRTLCKCVPVTGSWGGSGRAAPKSKDLPVSCLGWSGLPRGGARGGLNGSARSLTSPHAVDVRNAIKSGKKERPPWTVVQTFAAAAGRTHRQGSWRGSGRARRESAGKRSSQVRVGCL